jgi:chlorobactene lauroyltransferase
MQPNDYRPIGFYNGVSKIADETGDVNLIPFVFRYEFLMEQRPEVFISIGKVKINRPGCDIKNLTHELNTELVNELDLLKSRVTRHEFENFNVLLRGKSSRNKTLDNIYGKL